MSRSPWSLTLAAVAALVATPSGIGQDKNTGLQLPLKPKSVRFAVIGDMGTGEQPQYDVAKQMAEFRKRVQYDFVIMVGDNIYGSPDMKLKFETPYAALLSAGVKFYASLGNHDNPNQRLYEPYNMGGKRYYSFKKGDTEFFALDSNYMDPEQIDWVKKQLQNSKAPWKICFFHHPLYSDAKAHGSDKDLRARLEPIFQAAGVNVVFSGHDHVYERIKPQKGVQYFVVGSSGQLRVRNLRHSDLTAKGFDTDCAFLLAEIDGSSFYFQTISRTGETVDSGVVERQTIQAAPSGSY